MEIANNLKEINKRIKQACEKVNRDINEVNIIGVTKYVTIERAEELIAAGINQLGENRSEGLLEKYDALKDSNVDWHFIGTIQSRKVKEIIDIVSTIHSLDRLSVAKQINSRAQNPIDCFVQVNVSGESSKHGLRPEEVFDFIKKLQEFEQVRVVGLMTMAPHVEDKTVLRSTFKQLRELRDEIMSANFKTAPCHYLSMGMSNDFEIAIEEGATHIRLGSTLVG